MSKVYSLLFLLLIISVSARAQRPKPAAVSLPPADTVYFDRDWERTETLEEVSYARVAHRDASGKPVGTVRDYFYPSWKKQWEGKLAAEKPDKPTGLCCGWHENGQVSFRGTYLSGAQQADFRSWREDGREIKCRSLMQDALPLSTATLHCSNCMHSSRNVFTVDIPAGTAGIVYKLDVRDEGQPPISWSTALAVAAVAGSGGAAAPALLGTAASALLKQGNNAPTTVSTKCHWYITADPAAVQQFLASKGTITSACLRAAANTPQETRPIALPPGTRQLFVCVNNDNYTTDATATLSVTALVQTCK
ncbi:toxin-antitoxin system YwqK family antitoxin [Hymenobacter ruber]